MNFAACQGENRSDTRGYREDFQRRQTSKGAPLLARINGTPHSKSWCGWHSDRRGPATFASGLEIMTGLAPRFRVG